MVIIIGRSRLIVHADRFDGFAIHNVESASEELDMSSLVETEIDRGDRGHYFENGEDADVGQLAFHSPDPGLNIVPSHFAVPGDLREVRSHFGQLQQHRALRIGLGHCIDLVGLGSRGLVRLVTCDMEEVVRAQGGIVARRVRVQIEAIAQNRVDLCELPNK